MKAAVTIWVDIEVGVKLKEKAEKQGLSASALAGKLLEEALR